MDALEESVRAGMLREEGDGYRFGHPLIQRTVYDGLTLARRQRLHLRAAEAIEERHTGHLEPQLPALAGHYRRAGAAVDADTTIGYCVRAAEAAQMVFAYAEAVSHLEGALQTLELAGVRDDARRCDLLLLLGEALMPAGVPFARRRW